MQEYSSVVIKKEYLADDILELAVELVKPRSIRFRAGQFVFFRVNSAWKAYSITSLPADNHRLRFCVKLEPGGAGSMFVKSLQAGDTLEFSGPEGYFTANSLRSSYCFVATGIGIAPYLSIVPDLLRKKFSGHITLVHAAAKEKDFVYSPELKEFSRHYPNFEYVQLLSGRERIMSYINKHLKELRRSFFYVCGGKESVENISCDLAAAGAPADRVRSETFLYTDR